MQDYHEQAELRRYLWAQFPIICSDAERHVYQAHIGRLKAADSPPQDGMLRKMFGDWDEAWVSAELRDGFDAFTDRVLDRIARECPERFYVNRCEACGRIAATPKACICGWCGHQWFARRDEQEQMAEDAFKRVEQFRVNKAESGSNHRTTHSCTMDPPACKRAGTIHPDHQGPASPPRSTIRFRWRLCTWAAILMLALLATVPDPRAFYLIPLYPHGFDRAIGTAGSSGGGVVGYVVHLCLFVSILAARRRWFFFTATLAMIAVCAINTRGCHQILSGLSIDG